ncbi:MAG: shikimate dehydrogenase [Clostridia bacterium]|jgi:shikimate dehydrogenase|nr:shikimate dehydrogenase [Clostridia bacterium]
MNLFGLIGEKLAHSISPAIHELIFKYYGIDGEYKLYALQRDELQSFVKNNKLRGFNVTIPYKIDIMKYLTFISPEAEAIGAVNTVFMDKGKIKGYNTDYNGIDMTFKKYDISIENSSAIVLGSGGAAAAVLQYLKDKHCKDITIVVRDKSKKINLRDDNHKIIQYEDLSSVKTKDILVNCTPVGMYPNVEQCIVEEEFVKGFNFVFDLIYNPLNTKLLSYAMDNNIKCANGLLMLVGQAVWAESIWNNIDVKEEVIEKIYMELTQRGF